MSMEIFKGQAIKKLESEKAKLKSGTMFYDFECAIADGLIIFCNQSEEFAQAVAQGKSFKDCIKPIEDKITKSRHGSSASIKGAETYLMAAKFYFPTATINCTFTINTEGNNSLAASEEKAEPAKAESAALSMSLDDLLEL